MNRIYQLPRNNNKSCFHSSHYRIWMNSSYTVGAKINKKLNYIHKIWSLLSIPITQDTLMTIPNYLLLNLMITISNVYFHSIFNFLTSSMYTLKWKIPFVITSVGDVYASAGHARVAYENRSLRISTPHSDSACSSSAESSDCESTTHHQSNEDPVEIVPGVYLGNRQHSIDSQALAKYNIKVCSLYLILNKVEYRIMLCLVWSLFSFFHQPWLSGYVFPALALWEILLSLLIYF